MLLLAGDYCIAFCISFCKNPLPWTTQGREQAQGEMLVRAFWSGPLPRRLRGQGETWNRPRAQMGMSRQRTLAEVVFISRAGCLVL